MRGTLESKGFKISHKKIENMNCNFKRDEQRDVTTIRIEVQETAQRSSF